MYTIKEMPRNERPREKLMDGGAKYLNDHELLAIVLRTGTKEMPVLDLAKSLLYEQGGLKKITEMSVDELAKIKGIGIVKAIVLVAAIELGRRTLSTWSDEIVITSPKDVFDLLHHELGDLKQEVLIALYLDIKAHLIQKKEIYVGGLNQSLIHPREIFKYAVKCSAYQIILVHNHPSGDPEPSSHDIEITKKLVEAGNLMQIPLIDHVIVTKSKWISLMNRFIKK
jgi:DNA repair protein RadC